MKGFTARTKGDYAKLTLIWVCACVTMLSIIFLVGYILINGLPHISWSFLTDPYKPGLKLTGIIPMIISTLLLIVTTIIIAAPIGIMAAIFLTEYAKGGKMLNTIRFATECLAGIPSILYGLFGYALFVIILKLNFTILSGALTLSAMVLPLIIRNTEEALLAVPKAYREASLALGAGKLTTIVKVVLPSAIGGILTSVILSIGRIVGETAAVIYTMGSATAIPESLFSSGRSLSVHLYFLAKEGTDINQSFATAAVLLIMVCAINFIAKKTADKMKVKGTK